jgi:hypothetical protein
MATTVERRRIARLVHRFGFGPRPGEFQKLIAEGFDAAASRYLVSPTNDIFADAHPAPVVSDQGQRHPIRHKSSRMPLKSVLKSTHLPSGGWIEWFDQNILYVNG